MDKLLKKVDQMDDEERKRLRSLLAEKSKGEVKMDWMYRADKPDTEEYLLGRRIDKHIEEGEEPEPTDKAPAEKFEEVLARRAGIDMEAKMREDPLFAIRKKEENARRQLLENPIKMKMLEKQLKVMKKEKKKQKKHSDSGGDELMEKYLAILKKKKGGKVDLSKALQHLDDDDDDDGSSSSSSSDDDKAKRRRKDDQKHGRRGEEGERERDRLTERRGDQEDRHRARDERDGRRNVDRHDLDQRSREKYERRDTRRDDDRHRDDERNNGRGNYKMERRKDEREDHRRDRESHRERDDKHRERRNESRDKHRSPTPRNGHKAAERHRRDRSPLPSSKSRQRNGSSSDSDSDNRRVLPPHASPHKQPTKDEKRRKRSKSSSSSSSSSGSSSSSDESDSDDRRKKAAAKQYGLIVRGKKVELKYDRSASPVSKQAKQIPAPRKRSPPRKKLSADEMERRRKEMLDNANWRDKERERNVRRYNAEDSAEKAMLDKQKESGSADFLNPLMVQHATQSSVEDRLKRNRYHIQRVKEGKEGSFAKR